MKQMLHTFYTAKEQKLKLLPRFCYNVEVIVPVGYLLD